MSDPLQTVKACLSCGTCCFSRLETYVRVTGDDHARLGDQAAARVQFVGNRAFMIMIDGHCGALRIDEKTSQFECAVYGTRPEACRDLERGAGACQGELSTKGDRPLAALRLRRDAV